MSLINLEGKRALITGASRGLGAAIARAYAEAGADLALCARDIANLESVATPLRAMGRNVSVIAADLSDLAVAPTIIDRAVAALGGLDIVLNNAGISPVYKPTIDAGVDDWEQIFRVNVTAPFVISQAAARHMIGADGGTIIHMASVGGLLATPRMMAYGATKAALISMTRTMGVEWARHNIRVNAIAPGYIETDLTSGMLSVPRYADGIKAATPQQRIGRPEEITGIAVYLGSDAASFATGQVFAIDGGISAA